MFRVNRSGCWTPLGVQEPPPTHGAAPKTWSMRDEFTILRLVLFLGLGTGLGSALIVDGVVEPLELAHLPYKKGKTYEDYLGLAGLKRLGKKKWRHHVIDVVKRLKTALQAEYVVLGGGNARLLRQLPKGVCLGDNRQAFLGGFRLWKESPLRPTHQRFYH